MRVELIVDEVVLHGVDPRDRHRIGDAIERHLREALSRQSTVDGIAADAVNREQTARNVVTSSVRSAVAAPTARRE